MFTSLKKACAGVAAVILFLASCAVLSLLITFPLWKWASASPETYTAGIASAAAIAVAVSIIKKIKRNKCRKTS
ncbi:MAG: hypothetical protein J6O39_03500 [Treponema sp.]|nr:hypothetical protein [Treponema sp.]